MAALRRESGDISDFYAKILNNAHTLFWMSLTEAGEVAKGAVATNGMTRRLRQSLFPPAGIDSDGSMRTSLRHLKR